MQRDVFMEKAGPEKSVAVSKKKGKQSGTEAQNIRESSERTALLGKNPKRRRIFLAGMALIAFVWIVLIGNLLGSETPLIPVSADSKDHLNIAQAVKAETPAVQPEGRIENSEPAAFGTVSGSSGDVESVIFSGERIDTQETGKRVVVGVPKGSLSMVYLFSHTQAQITFQEWVKVNLFGGSVY